jgi:hypothetical protein
MSTVPSGLFTGTLDACAFFHLLCDNIAGIVILVSSTLFEAKIALLIAFGKCHRAHQSPLKSIAVELNRGVKIRSKLMRCLLFL